MSWFPERYGWARGELPEAILPDEPEGAEVAPGVIIERRRLLWAGAASFLGAATIARAEDHPPKPTHNPRFVADGLGFEELLQAVRPLAKRLVGVHIPNEDAYLYQVASLLARLDTIPEPRLWKSNRGLAVDQSEHFHPVLVAQMRMEPGARIELHDHRDYNGILFGIEGQVRVRNFEFADALAEHGSRRAFRIRETAVCVLTKGRCSTLGRVRDNIHEVVAGKDGARLLDVFTFFTKSGRSVEMDFTDKPVKGETGVYEVSWK